MNSALDLEFVKVVLDQSFRLIKNDHKDHNFQVQQCNVQLVQVHVKSKINSHVIPSYTEWIWVKGLRVTMASKRQNIFMIFIIMIWHIQYQQMPLLFF